MGKVVSIRRKRKRSPITIDGIRYLPVEEFAERVGVAVPTVYQWNSEGKLRFGIRYCGGLYYEEKAIEPFKRTLMEKVRIVR